MRPFFKKTQSAVINLGPQGEIEMSSKQVEPKLYGGSSFYNEAIETKGKNKSLVKRLWRVFRWMVSLRVLLPVVLVTGIGATVSLVWGFTYRNTNSAISDLSEKLREQLSERIESDIGTEFTLPPAINHVQRGYASLGYLSPHELDSLRRVAFTHVEVFEAVAHLYFGVYNGDFVGYRRGEQGELQMSLRSNSTNNMLQYLEINPETGLPQGPVLREVSFDASARPWYIKAKQVGGEVWSDIYLFASGDLGITASLPIYDSTGEVILVTAVDKTLGNINSMLDVAVTGQVRAVLIERNGYLVGSSNENVTVDNSRLNVSDSSDTIVRDSYFYLVGQVGDLRALRISHQALSYKFKSSQGKSVLLDVIEFNISSDLPLLLMVVVPEREFTETIHQNNIFTLIITIATVVVSSVVAILITILITSPLDRLSRQMKKVSMMQFEEIFQRPSILMEVRYIQKSFFKMIYALQSFRKFVPEAIIKQLMVDNNIADLSLETHNITIFFLDIVDFTSIAEQLETRELLEVIGEALEDLSLVVISNDGIVDKYIGDAIMALYNVPEKIDNPAQQACKTALECHERLSRLHSEWAERGLPQLKCRVGINSGKCLVGTFGSSKRLNYTAIGDAVNVAARLEPLNKLYGTTTLISETVYESAQQKYCARAVDNVRLKGRKGETMLFELLGERDKVTETMLDIERLTVKAFTAYRRGEVDTTMRLLDEALHVKGYAEDTALQLVHKRLIDTANDKTKKGGPMVLHEKEF